MRPLNVSELGSFLGFASYYCHFVEGFEAPLHKLVVEFAGTKSQKASASTWTEQYESSFEGLK